MFFCVQVLYTTNYREHLYSGIFKDPLDTKHKIFKKKTEFINVMFHVKNWSISLKVVINLTPEWLLYSTSGREIAL